MPDLTTRRAISQPKADRSDPADTPLYIRNVAAAVDADVIYLETVAGSRPAASLSGRIHRATDTGALSFDNGTTWQALGAVPPTFGLLSARPAAAAATGQTYYATDQDSISLSDGTNWIRVGSKPGDLIWTMELTARTGYIIPTGQAWPATTGIYADLFAKWGGLYPTVLPDIVGRGIEALGTHADNNTLGFNDGVSTVANRRMKHKHTNTVNASIHNPSSGSTTDTTSDGASSRNFTAGSITVGPQTGAEPTDTAPFIVMQPQVKL